MAKLIAMCATAILAGSINMAVAQDESAGVPRYQAPARSDQPAAPLPEAAAPRASEGQVPAGLMVGASIYNADGEEIASVEELKDSETGPQIIISVGQFLGLGGKLVMIPASSLEARAEGGFMVNYTSEQLEAMPEYANQEPDDEDAQDSAY